MSRRFHSTSPERRRCVQLRVLGAHLIEIVGYSELELNKYIKAFIDIRKYESTYVYKFLNPSFLVWIPEGFQHFSTNCMIDDYLE